MAARARHERLRKTVHLEPHREELLRLRRAGDSVEVLATALRGLGVAISDEALRLWLNRELGHKPTRRRKARMGLDRHGSDASSQGALCAERPTTALPAPPITAISAVAEKLATPMDSGPKKPSSLILPGETPLQAMHRRLAALGAARAAANGTN